MDKRQLLTLAQRYLSVFGSQKRAVFQLRRRTSLADI
jgi:hypothetical protein